jgi:tight adherence protein B
MDPTLILWIGVPLGIILLIAGVAFTVNEQRSFVDERLGRYLEGEDDTFGESEETSTPLTDWINNRVEGSSMGDRIAKELAQADLKLKPGEYVALIIIATFGVGFIGYFYGGRSILFTVLAGGIGFLIPRFYIKRQQAKRLVRFNDQLPDMLNLMVNGLRAGYSTMQAMEAVSKELPPPISDEFRRVVREMQLGIPMEDALANLLRRIPSDDLDLIITALNIQREVGGNLAEILDIISYTIRERIRIKREITTLVAQVLYSGRILAILPIGLGFFLWSINREYMNNFFLPETRLCGVGMLVTGGLMIIAGYFAMNKVADIEI